MQHIEDILEYIVNNNQLLEVFSNEKAIFSSINRQVKKGNALTDRQFLLIKNKLIEKKSHLDIDNFDEIVERTSMPFRKIDRHQFVSIEKSDSVFNGIPCIKIRFPFNKKTISDLEKISTKYRGIYSHQKGSHEHYFKLHEPAILDIVEIFSNKNFSIDPQLIEYAQQVKEYKNHPETFVPGIYNLELKNFRDSAAEFIKKEMGEITSSNLIKLYDRKRRYGIEHVDCDNPGGLLGHIVFRKDRDVLVNPEIWSIDHVVESLVKLDRFPLLVLIDDGNELEQVSKVFNAFSGVVPSEKQICLFRVENDSKYNLNNYIQDKNFNNFLDETTEIVYIVKSKLPKLLLRVDWKPMCVYALSSARTNNYVSLYTDDTSDLVIYQDKEHSPFRARNAYY